MTKVKICGNTSYEDARLALDLGADFIGFIFAPSSKRQLTVKKAGEILSQLGNPPNAVGVFCNQPKSEVEKIVSELGIQRLQFHGEETALYCEHFMRRGLEVIKTFHVKDAMSLKRLDEYNVSAFLFDTFAGAEKGGTGVPFDWSLIEDRPFVHEKLFLAGGLNIHNLAKAIDQVRPFAVDVASGVESKPGAKDPALLKSFIKIAHEIPAHDRKK